VLAIWPNCQSTIWWAYEMGSHSICNEDEMGYEWPWCDGGGWTILQASHNNNKHAFLLADVTSVHRHLHKYDEISKETNSIPDTVARLFLCKWRLQDNQNHLRNSQRKYITFLFVIISYRIFPFVNRTDRLYVVQRLQYSDNNKEHVCDQFWHTIWPTIIIRSSDT
jgi:hypothetical protein